jgi:predicted phosphodiesterase
MTKKEKVFAHLNECYDDLYADIDNKTEIARQINKKLNLGSNPNTLRDYIREWLEQREEEKSDETSSPPDKKTKTTSSKSSSSFSDKSDEDDGKTYNVTFSSFEEWMNFKGRVKEEDKRKYQKRKNFQEHIGDNLHQWFFVSTDQARKKVNHPENHLFCAYNLEERVYYFNFPASNNLPNVVADFSQMRRLIEAYVYYGEGKTRKQCTRILLDETDFAEEHGDIVRDVNGNPIRFEHTKKMLRALGIDKNSQPYPPHDIREKSQEDIIQAWREKDEAWIEKKKLETDAEHWKSRYKDIVSDRMDVRRILEEVANGLPEGDIRMDITPVDMDSSQPQYDMVLILADWHVGQLSDVKTNTYNKSVFKNRISRLKEKIQTWLQVHNRPIRKCWIVINGDMLDGPNGTMRPNQQYEQDLFYNDQTRVASRSLSEVISFVRGHLPTSIPISIQAVPGNHGRSTKKREDDPYRMIELATYQISEAITEDLDNVEWSIEREIFQDWLITDYARTTQVIQTHGDRSYKKYKDHIEAIMDKRADYHLLTSGHYHHEKIQEDLDKLGVQSGSLAGDEPYGLHRLAVGSRPSQRIMMVDNEGPYIPGQLIVDNLERPTK